MKRIVAGVVITLAVAVASAAEDESRSAADHKRPATAAEAGVRARILHEAIHGALQVMHRDFFDEDEGRVIPSRSLEDVFSELQRGHDVTLHWLAVNTKAMNVDHEPRSEFERDAVKAFAAGRKEFESVDDGVYRYAGTIRLSSRCLKCHVPNRTSTEDRAAGLTISMPLNSSEVQRSRLP